MNSEPVISEVEDPEAQEAIRRQVREKRIRDRVLKGIPRAKAEEAEAHGQECLAKNRESLISGIMEQRACSREQAAEFIAGSMRHYWQEKLDRYSKLKAKHPDDCAELEIETADQAFEALVSLNFPPMEVAVASVVLEAWRLEQSYIRGVRELKSRWKKSQQGRKEHGSDGVDSVRAVNRDLFDEIENGFPSLGLKKGSRMEGIMQKYKIELS